MSNPTFKVGDRVRLHSGNIYTIAEPIYGNVGVPDQDGHFRLVPDNGHSVYATSNDFMTIHPGEENYVPPSTDSTLPDVDDLPLAYALKVLERILGTIAVVR